MQSDDPGLALVNVMQRSVILDYWAAPTTGSNSRPRIVVWRCNEDRENETRAARVLQLVRNAMRGRQLEWELRKQGRNWVLAPKRYFDLEDSGTFRTYPEILDHLERVDPEFGRQTGIDLSAVAESVAASSVAYN